MVGPNVTRTVQKTKKCNTDDLCKTSWHAACGGPLRDNRGLRSKLAAELARDKGWTHLWLEMDSALTLYNFFRNEYRPTGESECDGRGVKTLCCTWRLEHHTSLGRKCPSRQPFQSGFGV